MFCPWCMMYVTGFIQSVISQISQFLNICKALADPTNIGICRDHQAMYFKDVFNMLTPKHSE